MAEITKTKPRLDIMVGTLRVKLYFDNDARPESYYYQMSIPATERTVSVAINQHHPYLVTLGTAGYSDFVRQCVYDAIAQFKAATMHGRVEPNTFRHYKDDLLRTSYKIHDEATESDSSTGEESEQYPIGF